MREPRFTYSDNQTHAAIQLIISNFSFLLDHKLSVTSEQALTWLDLFPPDIIEISMKIGAAWHRRQLVKEANKEIPTQNYQQEEIVVRYMSSVMRNKYEERLRYDQVTRGRS
jgi:hypothetical protein